MNNLVIRSITGVLFVAAVVVCLIAGPVSAGLLYALAAALTVSEFWGIMTPGHSRGSAANVMNILASLLVMGFTWLVTADVVSMHPAEFFTAGAFMLIPLIVLLVLSLSGGGNGVPSEWTHAFAAQLYVTLPFALLLTLGYPDYHFGVANYSFCLPLSIFILIWSNDTGAYCVGSLLHKRFPARMAPRISPNKSWVGTIGGGVLCLIVGATLSQAFSEPLPLPLWLGLALTVCVFGTLGDLVESKLKRTLGIKDSGHILPGHGGMLDRFDSLLLVVPAVKVYLALCLFF